jgi:hypothetical protein
MGRLYIAANVFAPSLIRPALSPDDYSHDARALHLILQPMLLKQISGPDADIDPLSVRDYFNGWATPDPARPAPVLVGEGLAKRIRSGDVEATPVPLPPGTRLKLALKINPALQGDNWSDERTVGLTTPVGSPVVGWDQLKVDTADGWPGFAGLSSALPLVRRYEDLGLPQPNALGVEAMKSEPSRQEVVRRWLVGLFNAMSESADARPKWRENDELEKVWAEVNEVEIPLSDIAAWDNWLAKDEGAGTPAARLYPDLIAIYNEIPPKRDEEDRILRTRPPRFEFRPHEVMGRPELFNGGLPIAGRSYLHALWTELANQVKRADSQSADDAKETLLRVTEACGRFFAFGERLSWPRHLLKGEDALRRFMVLRQKLDDDWSITNGVSLAGLVFRIDGILSGSKLGSVKLEGFEVQLPGAASAAVEPWEADDVADLVERAIELTQNLATNVPASNRIEVKPEWKVAYEGGGTRSDRAVYWKAQEGALLPMMKPSVPSTAANWHALPPALLDLADESRRTPSSETLALDLAPPRRGLRITDLVHPVGAASLLLKLPGRLTPFNTGEGAVLGGSGRAYYPFRVYALDLEGLHPLDAVAATWLSQLTAPGRKAEIWITPMDKAEPPFALELTNGILRKHPFNANTILIYDDEIDPLKPGPITNALGATDQGQAKPTDALVWSVEVVFTAQGSEPFNIVVDPTIPKGKEVPPPLWLSSGFVTRLGLSTDRILQSLAVTWRPEFDPDLAEEAGLQANYAADANKLRLAISGFAPGEGRRDLLVSDPDALLPLPESKDARFRPNEGRGQVWREGPQAWYWAAYHLDQDRDVSSLDEEAWRFHSWIDASSKRRLSGYMEHQFGYRIPVSELVLEMRRGVDVVHLADVGSRGCTTDEPKPAAPAPGEAIDVPRRPLIFFRESPTTPGLFEARLQRKAVQLAIQRLWSPEEDPAGRGQNADGGRFTAIRAVYRALGELRDAISKGNASLTVEGWRFDNRLQHRSPKSVDLGLPEPKTAPDVIGSLYLVNAHTAVVQAPPPGSPLAKVFAALDRPFESFISDLDAATAPMSTSTGVEVPDWALLAYLSLPNLHKTAHYARARLTIARDASVNPCQSWAEATFVPLHQPELLTPTEEARLANTARTELAKLLSPPSHVPELSPSRLWRSDRPLEVATRARETGLTLGDNAQALVAPKGPIGPDDRVSDLFYVPYAFLVPAAHPCLRDRQGTADFATWLVALAEALAAGGDTRGFIALNASGAAARVDLREEARKIVRDPSKSLDLVRRLEALLVRVERAEPGPTASLHEKALFEHVAEIAKAADEGDKDQRWRDVRSAMLERRPSLFGTTRAVALGIFNSDVGFTQFGRYNFNPQIFSIQLTKRVVRDGEQVDSPSRLRPTETERFDFTRFHLAKAPFFVDVLPEAAYDDLLVIGQNIYEGIDPSDFDQLGLTRFRNKIAKVDGVLQRGDAAAVSAERVIEGDGQPPATLGDVEVNFVHYNPDWRTKTPRPQFLYVLPERRIPATPRTLSRVLQRKGKLGALDEPELVHSPIRLISPSTHPNLETSWGLANKVLVEGVKQLSVPSGAMVDGYGRVPTAQNAGGPLWSPRTGPTGWQLLTTYATHHWFSLDLERADKSLAANLEDDVFEVEVEFWSKTPPAEEEPESRVLPSDPLLEWFDYGRRIAGGETALDAPGPVPAAQLLKSLSGWLVMAPDNEVHLGQTVLEPPVLETAKSGGVLLPVEN